MPGSFSDYAEGKVLNLVYSNAAFTGPTNIHWALYTVLPTDAGGGTEVTGGAYARVQQTNNATNFPAATAGVKKNATAVAWATATADWGIVVGWATFDAATAGNMLNWGELLDVGKVYTVDPATDTFTSTAHGLTNGTRVRVRNENGTLPAPLATGTDYYIITSAANTFQLSLTQGGAAVNVTTAGDGTNTVAVSYIQNVLSGNTISFAVNAVSIELN